ncbi:MAG: tetratricopeptide repeat protein [Leptospiraceae bacterium]
MTGRLLILSLCSYILISAGLSFKYYLNASPLNRTNTEKLWRNTESPAPPAGGAEQPEGAEEPESLFERAEEHFFSRRYNTSLALFLRVLQNNPEHSRAHSYAGDIYLIQKKLDEAEHHFRIAAEIGEEKHKSEFRLGQIAYLKKENREARTHLQQSLEHYPDFPPAVFYLGLVSWKLEDNRREAAQHWEKYLTLKPQDPQKVAIQQAIQYLKEEPGSEAEDSTAQQPLDLDKLLNSVEPQRPGANPVPGKNNVSDSSDPESNSEESSDSDKAFLDIARSLETHPERLTTVLNLAAIQKEQKNYDRASRILEEANRHSDDPRISAELSEIYSEKGQTAAARNLLRKQINRKDLELKDKALPALNLAMITQASPGSPQNSSIDERPSPESEKNQNPDSENSTSSDSKPALEKQPSSGDRTETDNPESSEENANPEDSANPANNIADAKKESSPTPAQDFSAAMDILEKQRGYSHLTGEDRKDFHLIQAREAFRNGDSSAAYAQTLRILKEDPADKRGLILAASIAQQSETATSFAVYEERIRSLYGNDPDMMTALAQIYARDDSLKARKLLNDTVKNHPDNVNAALALTELERIDQPEKALKRLEALLNKHPQNLRLLQAYVEINVEKGTDNPEFRKLLQRIQQMEKENPGSFPLIQKWNRLYPPAKTDSPENGDSEETKSLK